VDAHSRQAKAFQCIAYQQHTELNYRRIKNFNK